MIDEAETLLLRANALGCVGRYQLERALQSAHVHRRRTGQANRAAVIQLHDVLMTLSGSPVVALIRALAIAEIEGARAVLEAMQQVTPDARLIEYRLVADRLMSNFPSEISIDRLSAPEKELLQAASVIGIFFSVQVLREVTAQPARDVQGKLFSTVWAIGSCSALRRPIRMEL
jgi:hypothetical protein